MNLPKSSNTTRKERQVYGGLVTGKRWGMAAIKNDTHPEL